MQDRKTNILQHIKKFTFDKIKLTFKGKSIFFADSVSERTKLLGIKFSPCSGL